ncbi:hypothetical protein [Methylophaga sp. OBS4]|uniref:hypothetical protein n=1 Tax=Methylophaga sp. OBS4 TaxID=2991935 RepID=UPI00225AE4E5|nr:hypothetical protein [Methylophaga sp. OBS4]MCX4186766.1 hypothetical protein [Methylophaga sp. OBS4]
MHLKGMLGLGDNIYQRAFINQLPRPLYLTTPWPELYQDQQDIHFINPQTRLRTQKKNIERQPSYRWRTQAASGVRVKYGKTGILHGMSEQIGLKPEPLTLPDYGPSPVDGDYIIVRPVTLRTEWLAQSRNPLAEYVNEAAAALGRDYQVVSVADIVPNVEWPDGPLPKSDIEYLQGELDVSQLMALVQHAKAIVGGVGWLVPAAIAAGIPAWVVLGGHGAFNAPELITHPSQDCSRIGFAMPDNFCRCSDKRHQCNKTISNHKAQFERWRHGVCI